MFFALQIHPSSPAGPERPRRRRRRADEHRTRNAAIQAQAPRGAARPRRSPRGPWQHRHTTDLWPQQLAGRWPAGAGTLSGGAACRRHAVLWEKRSHRVGQIHTAAPQQGRQLTFREPTGNHRALTSRGLAGLRGKVGKDRFLAPFIVSSLRKNVSEYKSEGHR